MPFTVVITPVDAILTTPPPVANEVAPVESKVDTDVSPVTSSVPASETESFKLSVFPDLDKFVPAVIDPAPLNCVNVKSCVPTVSEPELVVQTNPASKFTVPCSTNVKSLAALSPVVISELLVNTNATASLSSSGSAPARVTL